MHRQWQLQCFKYTFEECLAQNNLITSYDTVTTFWLSVPMQFMPTPPVWGNLIFNPFIKPGFISPRILQYFSLQHPRNGHLSEW